MSSKKPLYVQIKEELREQILSGRFRAGDRLPSEAEISEHYQVSPITSKRALNDLMDEELIIRIKGKGSFVAGDHGSDILNSERCNQKGVVGIIFPSICMPVESALFYHIQSALHQKGYQTLICVTDDKLEKEMEAIRMFRVFGVRGFVIFPAINERYNEEILRLSLERFPHVLVDRYLPNVSSSYVISDNRQAMMDAVLYLMNQNKDIAFITPKNTNSNTNERMIEFEKALSDNGQPIDKSKWFVTSKEQSDEEIKAKLKAFFHEHRDITGVLSIDTPFASLSYAALCEMGLSIPSDVCLVSFDDPKLPFVPYIRQNMKEIAHTAVNILANQMESGYQFVCRKVPTSLITDVTYPLPFGLEV